MTGSDKAKHTYRSVMESSWDGFTTLASELMSTARAAIADNSAHAMNMWERASEGEYDASDWIQDATVFWERTARDGAKTLVATSKFISSCMPKRPDK